MCSHQTEVLKYLKNQEIVLKFYMENVKFQVCTTDFEIGLNLSCSQ